MKLIFCPDCHDVRRLFKRDYSSTVYCMCGASWGYYLEDGLDAIIGGKAVPLGFLNHSFYEALKRRPQAGYGSGFTAFVIPHHSERIRKKKNIDK